MEEDLGGAIISMKAKDQRGKAMEEEAEGGEPLLLSLGGTGVPSGGEPLLLSLDVLPSYDVLSRDLLSLS